MTSVSPIADLPNEPAVYAMYGGSGAGLYVAYVGVASKLKQRVTQHLVRRDSSVTTGRLRRVAEPRPGDRSSMVGAS